MAKEIRVGVAGVGGFAGEHQAALLALEEAGECRVVGTCDPDPERLGDASSRFGFPARKVRTYPHLAAMLSGEDLDVVTLPTPIPLHADQHAEVVASGAACYLEKPPSLWWPEFCRMQATEGTAKVATQVGFNFIADPLRRSIKKRILEGEFGELRTAALLAHWPRDRAYYGRNDWGGRLRAGGKWVLDSCIGNALAHYVQNLLFWSGGTSDEVAVLRQVRAELYRGHPIESFDTAFVEAEMEGGVRLRIAATHTGGDRHYEQERLELERATVVVETWRTVRIDHADGRVERLESAFADQRQVLMENFRRYFAYVRGEAERPVTRLADAESFVALCDLAVVSAGEIRDFASNRLAATHGRVRVEGLETQMSRFAEEGIWPGTPGTTVGLTDLGRLPQVAERLVEKR